LSLPEPFDRPHLVVFHGTYIPRHAGIARRLRSLGIPYLICAHGCMTRRAQRQSRWKKRLANLLFFRRMVARARAVQCLTDGEAATTGGWNRPLFVVGNGIDLPPEDRLASPGASDKLRLVFLGRLAIHHKGLDLLIEACRHVASRLRDRGARVELYGPDYHGDVPAVNRHILRGGLGDVIRWHGPVVGPRKTEVLRHSDVFVHTSRWAGHAMAVLEAMAYGLPCLLTPGTNMADEVAAAGAGWRVEDTVASIARGLGHVLDADPQALADAGRQARRLARDRYRWDGVAQRAVEQYRRWAA